MLDFPSPADQQEMRAVQARADLVAALGQLRERLTPAHVLSEAGHSLRASVAPVIDPLLAQAQSASGALALGGAAAALFFGLGRAEGKHAVEAAIAGKPEDGTSPDTAAAVPAKAGSGSIVKTLLVSAAAVAAGAVIATKLPVSDTERQFSATTGRDIKRWAKDHSAEIIGGAVNAFGLARGAGGLLALVALAAVAGNRSAKDAADTPSE